MTAATLIGNSMLKITPKKEQHKLIPIECPICHDILEAGKWVEKNSELTVYLAVCKKPDCVAIIHWQETSLAGQIFRAVKCGVGEKFIRNNELPSKITFTPAMLSSSSSYYLVGVVGAGKTWALCALVCDALADGRKALMINWHTLQVRIRSTYQKGATETEYDLLKYYGKLEVLCIDDLGATKTSESERTLLYAVLDARYSANAVTHISSNMTLEQLTARYDKRIGRRIEEMCRVCVLMEKI